MSILSEYKLSNVCCFLIFLVIARGNQETSLQDCSSDTCMIMPSSATPSQKIIPFTTALPKPRCIGKCLNICTMYDYGDGEDGDGDDLIVMLVTVTVMTNDDGDEQSKIDYILNTNMQWK